MTVVQEFEDSPADECMAFRSPMMSLARIYHCIGQINVGDALICEEVLEFWISMLEANDKPSSSRLDEPVHVSEDCRRGARVRDMLGRSGRIEVRPCD